MATIYTYTAFGLTFSSEIEIPEFLPTTGESQVLITLGNVPENIEGNSTEGFRFQISKNEFIIRFKPWVSFYVCNGNSIIIQPEKDADERDVRVFLISSVIAILLHQRGWMPLHASGIKVNNKAVLFSANSGIGKSTISLALNRKFGYPLIADDITIISEKEGKPIVHSSFPSAKLWQESIDLLGISNEGLNYIRKDVFKYRYDNRPDFFNGILEPFIVFVLENSDNEKVEISEVKGIEKFNVLRIHIFRLRMVNELYATELFKLISILLNTAKCFKISRPKNGNTLDELCSIVQSIITK